MAEIENKSSAADPFRHAPDLAILQSAAVQADDADRRLLPGAGVGGAYY